MAPKDPVASGDPVASEEHPLLSAWYSCTSPKFYHINKESLVRRRFSHIQGPPGSGKSTVMPAITLYITEKRTPENVIIYAVPALVDAQAILVGMSQVLNSEYSANIRAWPESREAIKVPASAKMDSIHLMPYAEVDKMFRDPDFECPSTLTFLIDVDPNGSVAFMMAFMGALAVKTKWLHVVTISVEPPTPLLRSLLAMNGETYGATLSAPQIPDILAEARQDRVVVSPADLTDERLALVLDDFAEPIREQPKVLLLDKWVLLPKELEARVMFWAHDPTHSYEETCQAAKRLDLSDHNVLLVKPDLILNWHTLTPWGITHMCLGGSATYKTSFDTAFGTFVHRRVEDTEKSPEVTKWTAMRAVNLVKSRGIFSSNRAVISVQDDKPSGYSERVQLFREDHIMTFLFRMVKFVEDVACIRRQHKDPAALRRLWWSYMGPITKFGGIQPKVLVELGCRLTVGGFTCGDRTGRGICVSPINRFWIGLQESTLALTGNCLPAARILLGVASKHDKASLGLKSVLVAVAAILSRRWDSSLRMHDTWQEMPENQLRSAQKLVGVKSPLPFPHGQGYVWSLLAAWQGVESDMPQDPDRPYSILPDAAERLTQHYCALMKHLGLGMNDERKVTMKKLSAAQEVIVHQELLCCSMDRLYWVSTTNGTQWPASGSDKGYEIMDLVTSKIVGAGHQCALLDVGNVAGLGPASDGIFAISTSPIFHTEGRYIVEDLTYIPSGVIATWRNTHLNKDKEDARPYPLDLDEVLGSSFRS